MSLRSYLHRFLGKHFRFRHVNTRSPVEWAISINFSIEAPALRPLRWPPPEVEAIFYSYANKGVRPSRRLVVVTLESTFSREFFTFDTPFSDLVGTKTEGSAASHLNSLSRFTSSGLHRARFNAKFLTLNASQEAEVEMMTAFWLTLFRACLPWARARKIHLQMKSLPDQVSLMTL